MFENIISYLFSRYAKNHINHTICAQKFVNYTNTKTILLLFESDYLEKNIEIRNIIKSINADGKKVTAWGYIDKKQVNTPILPDFRILNNQDLDFFRKPKEQFLQEIAELNFDLLIDLTVREIIPLQYLALHSNATLKTGLKKNKIPIYDFMIEIHNNHNETSESESELNARYIFNQILFYLKSIQTKD